MIYTSKPDGISFAARFVNPDGSPNEGYFDAVITPDGFLAALCNDGKWYQWRKAKPEDYETSKKCFRSIEDRKRWVSEMMLAA